MADAKLDSESSQVAVQLAAAGGILDEATDIARGFTKEAKNDRPAIFRAEAAAAHGKALLGLADPKLTSKNVADQVVGEAETLRNQLQEARDTEGGNIGPVVEDLLASLTRLRQPNALVEDAAKEGATRFKQSLEPRLRGVESEISRIEKMLNEVSESSGNESEALVQRLDTLKGEIETSEARVQELISDQDGKFTEAQEERRKEFADVLKQAQGSLAETQDQMEKRQAEVFERLDEIKTEVAETAASIGGRATALGHGAESIAQEKLAHRWSQGTIGLLLLAALVPIALGVLKAEQSPESVAGKISVALIIAGVASYAAGIARHHRERAAKARLMELEMTSFDPFISPLDPQERNDLRSTIIWRFFGPDGEPQKVDSPPRPGRDLREILHLRKSRRNGEEPPPPADE